MQTDVDTLSAKLTSISHNGDDAKTKVDALNELSYGLRNSDPQKALSYCVEAKHLATELSYEKGLSYSLRNVGICKWRLSDYYSSIEHFNESINFFSKLGDKAGKASSLNGLGIVYRKLRDYSKSIESYSESLNLYCELNDKHGEAICLNNIGVIYARLGSYHKAIRLYNSSHQIYKIIGEKYGEAMSLNNIGYAYTNLGNYSKALDSSLKAQTIFKEINDKHGEAETLTNIVVIYNKLKEFNKALIYEKRSLQIREETNDLRGKSNSLINIGNTYYQLGNLEQAFNNLFESLSIKREIGDREGEGNSLTSIAITYTKKGNLQKAHEYLKSSINIQREIGDKSGEIVSLTSMGRLLLKMKDYDEAIANLKTALKLAELIKSKDFQYEIFKILSDCYKHKGDFEKALENHAQFHKIKYEVFNEQSDSELKNLQVIYEVDALETEVQRLKNVELQHALSELTSALYASEIISRTDSSGNITYVNDNFCNITGFSSNELIGKNHRIIKSGFHSRGFYQNLWETIKQGKVWKGEIKNKSKDGKLFWLDTTIIPIFDASKKLTEFLAITKNITSRKDAEDKLNKQYIELEKTNSELEKTNHELDKFVYRASHDLRAPLTSVLGLIDLAKSDKGSKEIHKNLDMMKRSIDRLDRFVIDIINYYRNSRKEIKKERIDFNQIITESFDDLLYLDGANKIKTKININENVPFYSDVSQLRVIISNLLSNAIKYCKSKLNNSFIEVNVNVTKEEVTIQVIDNGVGIDKKHVDKIFDMFFKNSNSTYSSGLGLYILKETVNKLEGTITVDSELNKGSKFTIRIPNK